MYKFMILLLYCTFFISCSFANEELGKINDLINSLTDDSTIEFSVDTKKNTLLITEDKKEVASRYKLIIDDIHPEGIFYTREKGETRIKILSLNNYNVFTEDVRKNNKVSGRTINIVELIVVNNNEVKVKEIINLLKQFVAVNQEIKKSGEAKVVTKQ